MPDARSTGPADELGGEQLGRAFAALLAHAGVGLALVDRDMRFVAINETLAGINGLPVSETVGKTVAEVVPELAATVVPLYERALAGEVVAGVEITGEAPRAPDERRVLVASYFPVSLADGTVTGVVVVVDEVTVVEDVTVERRIAEATARYVERLESLRELDVAMLTAGSTAEVARVALERLRVLVPFARGSVTLADLDRNEAETLALLGSGPRPPARYPIPETLPLDRLARGEVVVIEDLRTLAREDERVSTIVDEVVNAGVRATALLPLLVEGELFGTLSLGAAEFAFFTPERLEIGRETAGRIALAIRQRRLDDARQEALRRLEILRELGTELISARAPEEVGAVAIERARQLVPCRRVSLSMIVEDGRSGVLLASVGADERVLQPGIAFELREGPANNQLRAGGVHVMEVDAAPLPEAYRQGLQIEGATWLIVAPLIVDGSWVGALTFGFAAVDEIRPEHVETVAQIATPIALALRDVTLLAALEESERRFRTLADSTSVMIWVGDEQGRDVFNNRGWLDFRGTTPETESEHPWPDGVHPDDVARVVAEHAQAVLDQNPCTFEYRMLNAAGEYRTVLDTSVPLRRNDGSFAGHVGTAVDITGMLRLEAQLQQSQKLEAVGRLASGVAHDFNNLIGVIAGYAGLIEDDPDVPFEARGHASEIRRAGSEAAELTRRLLAFGREQAGDDRPRPIELRALVLGLRPMLSRLLPATVDLHVEAGDEDVVIIGSSTQLGQLLVNLAVNGADAMPNGGRLGVELETTQERVTITVTDTGTGIAAEAIPHVFDPFFTTKEVGKGTGLGLSTVRDIVEDLGGTLSIDSAVGVGTRVAISLPRSSAVPATDVPPGPSVKDSGTTVPATILVVEDNALVRNLVRTVLRRAGHTVETATDGALALGVIEAGLRPDLVISDVAMPGGGGPALLKTIADMHPELPVLLMSGYVADLAGEIGDTPFIQKPFTPTQLVEAVAGLLDPNRRR